MGFILEIDANNVPENCWHKNSQMFSWDLDTD